MAGGAASAFEDGLAGLDGAGVVVELATPTAAEVVHGVVGAAREVPAGCGGLLDGEGGGGAVFDGGGAAEDAGVGIDGVAEGDEDVAGDVAEDDGEGVAFDGVGEVVEDEVAVAVGEGDLEGWLVVEFGAPACELLRGVGVGEVEGGSLGKDVCCGDVVTCGEAMAPVKGLELVALVDAEDVGDGGGIEAEGAGGAVVGDGRGLREDGWDKG